MLRTVFVAGVCALALLACNGEERRLTEKLVQLEQQHASVTQRVESRRNAIGDSQRHLARLNTDLTAHTTEIHAFLGRHKVASACIQASRSSWGGDGTVSAEVTSTSRIGAVLCGVALLNDEFSREVAYVTEKLREADTRVKELKEQMAAIERTIENERVEMRRDQDAADTIAAEMAAIQRQLSGE